MSLIAYFGPETFLPLTSVLAGVAGIVLMFGRNTWRIVGDVMRKALRIPGGVASTGKPPSATAGPMSRRRRYLNRGRLAATEAQAGVEEGADH